MLPPEVMFVIVGVVVMLLGAAMVILVPPAPAPGRAVPVAVSLPGAAPVAFPVVPAPAGEGWGPVIVGSATSSIGRVNSRGGQCTFKKCAYRMEMLNLW